MTRLFDLKEAGREGRNGPLSVSAAEGPTRRVVHQTAARAVCPRAVRVARARE